MLVITKTRECERSCGFSTHWFPVAELISRGARVRGDAGPYAADGVHLAAAAGGPVVPTALRLDQKNQWEPLWDDAVRVAERILSNPTAKHHPHFLGAVVLQQVQKQTGQMQERTIIDGQQRLTTLQLLLDALHAELLAVNAQLAAMRIEPLVTNAEPFCSAPTDRFKVWPTNRDRPPSMP